MKRLLMIFVLPASLLWFGSSQAFAEEASKPDDPPAPVAAPTEWYLRFDQPNLNVLSACIPELPKRVADPFLANIQAQITGQAALIAALKAKP